MTSGEQLGVIAMPLEQGDRLVGGTGSLVVELCRNHAFPLAALMASHTRWGEAGMATSVTPRCERASTIAFMTAGVAAIVPASPIPLTPRGFVGLGVTVRSVTMLGNSAADGTR